MINMEEYKDLIDEIRKLSDEEARCEVTTSVTTEGDVCEHGNSYASNCSDCDEEEVFIDDDLMEAYEWYENWKRENFNNEKK